LNALLKDGITMEQLIRLARCVPVADLSYTKLTERNYYDRYIEFMSNSTFHRIMNQEYIIDVLYFLKRGVIFLNPSGGNESFFEGDPLVVSFDTDVTLSDAEYEKNAEDLSTQEIAAMHISEFPMSPFYQQTMTRFLATAIAGTNQRRFVDTLRTIAPAEVDEELVVAFDTDIGGVGGHMDELTEAFSEVHGKEGLKNVRIVTGSGSDAGSEGLSNQLSEQLKTPGKKTRVVIIGRQANIENKAFKAFEDKETVRIVEVNDSELDGLYDISVTHIIEDVLRDETIGFINFSKPDDMIPISDKTELERRNRERAKFLRAA